MNGAESVEKWRVHVPRRAERARPLPFGLAGSSLKQCLKLDLRLAGCRMDTDRNLLFGVPLRARADALNWDVGAAIDLMVRTTS